MMTFNTRDVNAVLGLPLIIVGAALPLFVSDSYHLHSATMIIYFAYMASAWNFVCGYVGQLCSVTRYLRHHRLCDLFLFTMTGLSPWFGMLAGGAVAALLSLAIGYPTFRLKGPDFTLTTIAFAEIVRIWIENTDEFLGLPLKGAQGLLVPPVGGDSFYAMQYAGKTQYYYIIFGMLLVFVAMTFVMERSRLGFYLKAIRGDRDGPRLSVSIRRATRCWPSLSAPS